MSRLEYLLSMLIRIEDIAQAPLNEQHLLVDNIEDLQDQLKTILQATGRTLSPDMLMLPTPSKPKYPIIVREPKI